MRLRPRTRRFSIHTAQLTGLLLAIVLGGRVSSGQETRPESRTVKAFVQTRPGGPRQETPMRVVESPVDLPIEGAARAPLEDDDLILGVVIDG